MVVDYLNDVGSNSPNYSTGDEEKDGSKDEGEALHEVQCGGVDGVEEAAGHQKTQGLNKANNGKQGTWGQIRCVFTFCHSLSNSIVSLKYQFNRLTTPPLSLSHSHF